MSKILINNNNNDNNDNNSETFKMHLSRPPIKFKVWKI